MLSPVAHPNFVASAWGSPRKYRATASNPDPKHEGLDFRAAIGDPAYAVDDGVVITSKNALPDPAGEMISILHPSGILSRYMHLSQRLVKVGDRVRAGQLIAKTGRTGITTSKEHLHFDLKVKPDKLSIYSGPFGIPGTGFFPAHFGYVGIPAEAYIPVDQWAKGVKEDSENNGIPIYSGGLGLMGIVILSGIVYFVAKG